MKNQEVLLWHKQYARKSAWLRNKWLYAQTSNASGCTKNAHTVCILPSWLEHLRTVIVAIHFAVHFIFNLVIPAIPICKAVLHARERKRYAWRDKTNESHICVPSAVPPFSPSMQATNTIIGASSLESHAAKQKYPARPMTQPIGYLPTLKTTLQKDKKKTKQRSKISGNIGTKCFPKYPM